MLRLCHSLCDSHLCTTADSPSRTSRAPSLPAWDTHAEKACSTYYKATGYCRLGKATAWILAQFLVAGLIESPGCQVQVEASGGPWAAGGVPRQRGPLPGLHACQLSPSCAKPCEAQACIFGTVSVAPHAGRHADSCPPAGKSLTSCPLQAT